MRFAFKTAPQHTTWRDMLAVWRVADDIEVFESGWTFDHFYPIFSDPTGPCLEGWTVTTALAQATRRLRLGVLVTGIVYRHPAVLANMAATVDIISDGRLELGLGAGWNEEECHAYGIELGTLRERFDRFDEALQVITGLLSNTTTDFQGEYFTLAAARCEPKAIQRPHPPICIGGTGEQRTLRSVARFAQHWNYPGGPVAQWQAKRDVLAERCAEVGRDAGDILTSTHVRFNPEAGVGELAEQAAAFGEAGLDLAIVQLPPPHDPAVLEPIAAALAPLRSLAARS
ncbi:MAG TPA: LLM class F420-dependent oxidoreductase [Acidimicrobiales bacterium]|nr:LLM class F420-dependent oxidoreductase [Acidimicrobiales bacterium]